MTLKPSGQVTAVFSNDPIGGCGPTDIPDGPARAVRLADGSILMMASSAENFPFRGMSILDMHKSCTALFHGRQNNDPATFDDRSWLLTPFSRDGIHILGLVHNEFQGHRRPWLCPDGKYVSCWYNSITAVESDDGGRTFTRPPGQSYLLAVPRYRYDQTVGRQAGYFEPTNIVPYEGGFAFLAYTPLVKDQNPGSCVFMSHTPMEVQSWHAFDGNEFSIDLSRSPYGLDSAERPKPCLTVSPNTLRWPLTSIVLHRASRTYIGLMVGGDPKLGTGVFYVTSPDLIHWAGPIKLLDATIPSHFSCGDNLPRLYPSLLDPTSDDGNFGTIGNRVVLFSTQVPAEACHLQFIKGTLTRQSVTLTAR